MSDGPPRFDLPPPGGVAWLDVSAEDSNGASGRTRTGPLGLQISALPQSSVPYFFKGARLRGTRCIWSASTVSGAELYRPARAMSAPQIDGAVHVLARIDCAGSVFDQAGTSSHGVLRVIDAVEEVTEQFLANSHLFTLNVPQAAIGLDPGMLAEMFDQNYELTPFQSALLRSAVTLLLVGSDELQTPPSLVGVDRYLAAMTGLLLRTAVRKPSGDVEQLESVRTRTDAIIYEQAADALLTPATIAAQLNISLRQLYRAFNGTESPAARIRRRRLERAAELLSARSPQPQVERVAAECGFASAEYFSRAFRREFGLSPRAYRSAHRDVSVGR
ncbi:MAG: AraC-type DNA-binding protein [Pseudonocardiales bacterium]|nr:AraC-type DNA-binding protein [Pseudonocardiales bacterium]